MEGYNKDVPDIKWWNKQVHAGMQYRKDYTRQGSWDIYRSFYRNRFKTGLFTKNIFFTIRRSLVPRTYFRNPRISVVSLKPGLRHLALAKVMERIYNSLILSMNIKGQMRRIVDTAFITGTGVGKLGFGAEYTPTPEPGGTEVPRDKLGRRSEFRSGIVDNMPWFLQTPTEHFVLPEFCETNESAWFQAHWITRHKDDVINDPRLEKVNWKNKAMPLSENDPVITGKRGMIHRDMVNLLEIRDRRTKKVMIFAPYETDDIVHYSDDELQTDYSSPWYVFTPNPDDEIVWGVSDSSILHQYQEQLNEIKTKMHWHMRLSIVKVLYEKGAIDSGGIEKFLSEDVSAAIEMANINKIKIVTSSLIPEALFQMENQVMNDIREVTGFSRNAFGEYNAKSHGPTTVETKAVQESLNLRTDERRDLLSDMLVSLFKDIQLIIFRHWKKEQVLKVVGPDGYAVWVKFTGEMLKEGEYEISINPDSAVTETKEVREQRAAMYYDKLSLNPLIDNVKLTKYFLNELPGVNFEDLLLEQQPINNTPENVDQFASRYQNAPPQLQEPIVS